MDIKVGSKRTQTACWRECEICGNPASWRITFLDDGTCGARKNPASSAYGKDDCSWCSDAELFACKKHQNEVRRICPNGFSWCATFPLSKYKSMGFYWRVANGH